MSGNNHIIVLRYDLQKIIEAVLLHMNNAWETDAASMPIDDMR
jgi:hypothetical protein